MLIIADGPIQDLGGTLYIVLERHSENIPPICVYNLDTGLSDHRLLLWKTSFSSAWPSRKCTRWVVGGDLIFTISPCSSRTRLCVELASRPQGSKYIGPTFFNSLIVQLILRRHDYCKLIFINAGCQVLKTCQTQIIKTAARFIYRGRSSDNVTLLLQNLQNSKIESQSKFCSEFARLPQAMLLSIWMTFW